MKDSTGLMFMVVSVLLKQIFLCSQMSMSSSVQRRCCPAVPLWMRCAPPGLAIGALSYLRLSCGDRFGLGFLAGAGAARTSMHSAALFHSSQRHQDATVRELKNISIVEGSRPLKVHSSWPRARAGHVMSLCLIQGLFYCTRASVQ